MDMLGQIIVDDNNPLRRCLITDVDGPVGAQQVFVMGSWQQWPIPGWHIEGE